VTIKLRNYGAPESAWKRFCLGFWTWDIRNDHLVGDPKLAFLFGIDAQTAAVGTTAETFIRRVEASDQPAT
jgi:hypothetical protein